MKKYTDELLKGFENNITHIDRFGVTADIIPIPDDLTPGVLDARELPYALAFADHDSGAAPDMQTIRRATGYVNYNINTVEILTDCIDIPRNDSSSLRIWVYWPRKPFDKKDRAGLIYLHGGSFFAGSPFICENPCRFLAEAADCVVFNVDYSLAPERPYPCGYDDCCIVLDYVYKNADRFGIDCEKLALGGDSAGALIAAAVTECDEKKRIKYNAFFYPCVTFEYLHLPFEWKESEFDISDSQRRLIEPKLCLGRSDHRGNDKLMLMIKNFYLKPEEDYKKPSVSPLEGTHKNISKALIVTAEYDGLRYNGEYYAGELKKAGVDVRLVRYRGVFHAFIEKIGILPQAEHALRLAADDIKNL